ncbi:MAG: alkaline phosphatase family protein [Panacibacter sp.]
MNKIVSLVVATFLVFVVTAQQKKVLYIIADGIPADVIEKISTPTLDAIAKLGGYTRAHVGGDKDAYSQTPTISAVGYNSLLTGTWVNKHNVWDNDIAVPNYNYWNIFRLFKTQYPEKKAAIFSTWLDNRTKLIGEGLPQAGNIQLDYHFDGLELDTVKYPHDKESNYIHLIDEAVVDNAASYIRANAPDLSWVYLEYTDDMGHQYGDSKQFYSAVEMMDVQVSRIWQAIQYRQKNFKEDWTIFITTDHGRDSVGGHGGQSDRERTTWIVTNAKDLNNYFHHQKPGIVDIMPTIASLLNIVIPKEQLTEIDGIPLTGKLSAISPTAQYENGKIKIQWQPLEKTGTMKIWVAKTNQFKTGGKDDYKLVTQVPLVNGKATIDVSNISSAFYKIVLEAPHNFLNRWVIVSK